MYKKILTLITIIVVLFTVTGCTKIDSSTDSGKFVLEYQKLNNKADRGVKHHTIKVSTDNPFKYINIKTVVNQANKKDDMIIFFGNSEDEYSRIVVESLIKIAKKRDITTIYYVDMKEVTKKTDGYNELIELLKPVLKDNELTTPSLVAIKEGEVQQLETGISKNITNPYKYLTKNDIKYMEKQFDCILKCNKPETNTCVQEVAC